MLHCWGRDNAHRYHANLSVTLQKVEKLQRPSSQKENSHLNALLSESNFLLPLTGVALLVVSAVSLKPNSLVRNASK